MPTRRPRTTPNCAAQPSTKGRPVRRGKRADIAKVEQPLVVAPSTALVVPDNAVIESGGPALREILADPWLRFTNLYCTKNKHGERVHFKPWPEQVELYRDMHFLNVILKARQRGVTTAVQLIALDRCLFNDDTNAGVIAHNVKDAQAFFDDKIKFAYDNLPDALRCTITAKSDNKNELAFSNGSSIRVGTSMRSGTLQFLHISEYGKLCATMPEKAQELRAGALNTVASGNIVVVESTAEGAHGHFYELCDRAEKLKDAGTPLTDLDYKFFFFPWWRAPESVLRAAV